MAFLLPLTMHHDLDKPTAKLGCGSFDTLRFSALGRSEHHPQRPEIAFLLTICMQRWVFAHSITLLTLKAHMIHKGECACSQSCVSLCCMARVL